MAVPRRRRMGALMPGWGGRRTRDRSAAGGGRIVVVPADDRVHRLRVAAPPRGGRARAGRAAVEAAWTVADPSQGEVRTEWVDDAELEGPLRDAVSP
jgi:hypothetical protein